MVSAPRTIESTGGRGEAALGAGFGPLGGGRSPGRAPGRADPATGGSSGRERGPGRLPNLSLSGDRVTHGGLRKAFREHPATQAAGGGEGEAEQSPAG